MVTSKINELNEQDLDYLDSILQKEFNKAYEVGNTNTIPKIRRIRAAVKSQKSLLTMLKW
jgi:hypothetical protein